MCQYYLVSQQRHCKLKGEPYCHVHKKIVERDGQSVPVTPQDGASSSQSQAIPVDSTKNLTVQKTPPIQEVPIEQDPCCICYEDKNLWKPRCGHILCTKCTIFMEKDSCPMCRASLRNQLSDEIKEYRSHYELKNKKIKDLENEIRSLQAQINMGAIPSLQSSLIAILAEHNAPRQAPRVRNRQ